MKEHPGLLEQLRLAVGQLQHLKAVNSPGTAVERQRKVKRRQWKVKERKWKLPHHRENGRVNRQPLEVFGPAGPHAKAAS